MRHVHWGAGMLACLVLALGAQASGCFYKAEEDELKKGDSGSSGAGGDDLPPDPSCIPSTNADPVKDDCGVFVSTSAQAGGDGTQAAPFTTFAEAIPAASQGKKTIYACAEVFTERVELQGGIDIYGGLDCSNSWRYVGDKTKTELTANADQIPLTIFGGSGTNRIEDLHVVAAPAEATGGSSVAVVVDQVTVDFKRCTIEAQDAMTGASGSNYGSSAQDGAPGSQGGTACSASQVLGGAETTNQCGSVASVGGVGGNGNANSAVAGSPGLPDGAANGGAAEATGACTAGTKGNDGATGQAAAGASGLGTIARAGYTGQSGNEGTPGAPGQGGGGGGGSKGGSTSGKCSSSTSAGGASGGSGGSGGCGGAGGHGGKPGGSSIALVSLSSILTFDSVTLHTATAGNGGAGGPGQEGGTNGPGGPGGLLPPAATNLNPGCQGGPGGQGGKGGQGGGGLGGHSIAIAYRGVMPPAEGFTPQTGTPGLGGTGAGTTGKGADGVAAAIQEFN